MPQAAGDQFTDVQLKDGTQLRLKGANLNPDQVRQGVERYRNAGQKKSGMTPPPLPAYEQVTGISAAPKPIGVLGKAEQWLGDLGNDIRYGGESTIVGRGLKKMGAQGTSVGNPESVGEFMASPILGTVRAAKGLTEIPQPGKHWQGTKDVVGGAMQATEIPASVTVPEGVEGVRAADAALSKAFGSIRESEQLFKAVNRAVGTHPVEVTEGMRNVLMRAQELEDTGSYMPPVVRKFIDRISDADKGPLTFREARDFAVNVGKLSVEERTKLTPVMKAQIAKFAEELAEANRATAARGGSLENFQRAMKTYRRAMQTRRAAKTVAKVALTGGAAYMGKKYVLDKMP